MQLHHAQVDDLEDGWRSTCNSIQDQVSFSLISQRVNITLTVHHSITSHKGSSTRTNPSELTTSDPASQAYHAIPEQVAQSITGIMVHYISNMFVDG